MAFAVLRREAAKSASHFDVDLHVRICAGVRARLESKVVNEPSTASVLMNGIL